MEKTEETCSGFVIRDRERIDQEYDGGKWQAIRQHLDSLAKQGEKIPELRQEVGALKKTIKEKAITNIELGWI